MAEFNEFELIEHFFSKHDSHADVVLGVGDDGAVVRVPDGHELVIALDTLNEGVHFLPSMRPRDIGYKSLAVNLSDLAAMGATPAWFTLALSLPEADSGWLQDFSAGLYEAAAPFEMALIGGDTTRGPRSITIQVAGYVPDERYLARRGANVGDAIYVTGELGDAAAGLDVLKGKYHADSTHHAYLVQRHNRPTARVIQGQQLLGLASACIDISDGLVADLGHIVGASQVGAQLRLETLPASQALRHVIPAEGERYPYMLSGGEDYELCICVPPDRLDRFERTAQDWPLAVTRIGEIRAGNEIRVLDQQGNEWPIGRRGFDHFQGDSS